MAGYVSQTRISCAIDVFWWLDEQGKRIPLKLDGYAKEPHVGFREAERLIREFFGKYDQQVTREEIAVWLEEQLIHAWNLPYSTAWRVDYPKWVDDEYKRCEREKPTLEGLLTRLYFNRDELEKTFRWFFHVDDMEKTERWLTREQLLGRWKERFAVDERMALAIIKNHLENPRNAFMSHPITHKSFAHGNPAIRTNPSA